MVDAGSWVVFLFRDSGSRESELRAQDDKALGRNSELVLGSRDRGFEFEGLGCVGMLLYGLCRRGC